MNEKDKSYFSKELQDKALAWINSKWLIKNCEICQTSQWELANFIVAAPRFEGGIIIGGPIAPHVMVMCKNCGNTKFFNAVIMGLIKEHKESPNE
ncbi:hypothetical protein [Legionella longbeachae]|uniref:hypothetical protein n=1 Tax=Legionella longbeachae TaxID=450 RepID=UPI0001BEBCA2|nr:hypothetical protein [Legionella longbeachae]EEZ95964.1 hypothetical protein LLB_1146 [Legionella longbeachae D-4968]